MKTMRVLLAAALLGCASSSVWDCDPAKEGPGCCVWNQPCAVRGYDISDAADIKALFDRVASINRETCRNYDGSDVMRHDGWTGWTRDNCEANDGAVFGSGASVSLADMKDFMDYLLSDGIGHGRDVADLIGAFMPLDYEDDPMCCINPYQNDADPCCHREAMELSGVCAECAACAACAPLAHCLDPAQAAQDPFCASPQAMQCAACAPCAACMAPRCPAAMSFEQNCLHTKQTCDAQYGTEWGSFYRTMQSCSHSFLEHVFPVYTGEFSLADVNTLTWDATAFGSFINHYLTLVASQVPGFDASQIGAMAAGLQFQAETGVDHTGMGEPEGFGQLFITALTGFGGEAPSELDECLDALAELEGAGGSSNCNCGFVGTGTDLNVQYLCQTENVCYNLVEGWCGEDEAACEIPH